MERQQASQTLYERLGDDKLQELVKIFYDKVYTHPSLKDMFHKPIEEERDRMFCFLTQYLGGPTRYNQKYGHPRMRKRHMTSRIDHKAKEDWLSIMHASISMLDIDADMAILLYNCFPSMAERMVNSKN
jgi:hemoglobin